MSGSMGTTHVTDDSGGAAIKVKERGSNHADTVLVNIRLLLPVGLKAWQSREINIGMVIQKATKDKGWTIGKVKMCTVSRTQTIGLEQWQQDMAQANISSKALGDTVLTKRLVEGNTNFVGKGVGKYLL